MHCQPQILITAMIFATGAFIVIGVYVLWPIPTRATVTCPDGRSCPATWICCAHECCAPSSAPPSRRDLEILQSLRDHPHTPHWSDWYIINWPLIVVTGTLIGICLCAFWCLCCRGGHHRQCSCMFACCFRRPTSNHDSAGSCYPPPQYSRCGSFHQAPPPYSEVTSKPDLYPLVITCGEGDNKSSGNYLMVHYFRNYVIRAPGSLSATSTAESLNSSFICNATNEANSIIPPPYSCASNYEEWRGVGCGGALLRSFSSLTEPRSPCAPPRSRTAPPAPPTPALRAPAADMSPDDTFRKTLITSPVQPVDSSYDLELELIEYDLYCETGCRPRLGPSPPVQDNEESNVFEHDFERLRHLYAYPCPSPDVIACESPPQPTSPTQTSRESTLRRPSDDRRHRRPDVIKKNPKARKSSLYMPLTSVYPVRPSRVSPGSRVSSRSAPATPCGALVPNILALTQRVSASRHGSRSSKLGEECDPLLADDNSARADHKF